MPPTTRFFRTLPPTTPECPKSSTEYKIAHSGERGTARRAGMRTPRKLLVRKGGLEPPRFYPPDPKSGASANSATFARLKRRQRSHCSVRLAALALTLCHPDASKAILETRWHANQRLPNRK